MSTGGNSPEKLQRQKVVYSHLRELVDDRLRVFSPTVGRMISVVTFAFYVHELPINIVEVNNPLQEDQIDLGLQSRVPPLSARYIVSKLGQMDMVTEVGSDLATSLVDDFELYLPRLHEARSTALVELPRLSR